MPAQPNPLAEIDVQLESTAEQVAGALREAIIDGRLGQGTYLREVPLSEQFGVSRNTIREAIQVLVGERLVTRQMHRGAFVSSLGVDDIRDLYRVRRVVELPAVAGADPDLLESSVRQLRQAIKDRDRAGIVAADLLFHGAVVQSMHSDRLGGLFESLEGELRLCMSMIGGSFPDAGAFVEEHAEITAALADEDGARARELLARHLDDAEDALVAVLEAEARSGAAQP